MVLLIDCTQSLHRVLSSLTHISYHREQLIMYCIKEPYTLNYDDPVISDEQITNAPHTTGKHNRTIICA